MLRWISIATVTFAIAGAAAYSMMFSAWKWSGKAFPSLTGVRRARLVVCSQNLNRLGEVKRRKPRHRTSSRSRLPEEESAEEKVSSLVHRMKTVGCDVVAIQEISGSDSRAAERSLEPLRKKLSLEMRREYRAFLGDTEDHSIRNGFLLAEDLATTVRFESYVHEPLRRLNFYGPVGRFLRSPVGLILRIATESGSRKVLILNIHFKSRAFGYKDVHGTDFELLRMEMAETSRCLLLREQRALGRDTLVVLLGDRNSDRASASAEILSGRRRLEDFRRSSGCRLDESLEPDCDGAAHALQLIPILEKQDSVAGTYRYQGKDELLDEILISAESFPSVQNGGGLRAGAEGTYRRGSDHKLVWGEFNLTADFSGLGPPRSVAGELVQGSDISWNFCESKPPLK